jgi:fatty acid desaturase
MGTAFSAATAREHVDLSRIAWVVTVLACLVAVVVLAIQGYLGYAGVTLAVAISAGVNLLPVGRRRP